MSEFEFYSDWKVEVANGQKGRKTIITFSDMTRGQVLLLLGQQGYTNWRFVND